MYEFCLDKVYEISLTFFPGFPSPAAIGAPPVLEDGSSSGPFDPDAGDLHSYRGCTALLVRGADSIKLPKLECVHVFKGLALPRAIHSGETALADSQRQSSAFRACCCRSSQNLVVPAPLL